ncbi:hypothetical protein BLOT_010720 [Blomia tropicalis]|nr:hypothetical protein BLOT_010720 [Blomia tropicalis]
MSACLPAFHPFSHKIGHVSDIHSYESEANLKKQQQIEAMGKIHECIAVREARVESIMTCQEMR